MGKDFDRMKHVSKGWGSELWIINSSLYCGKLLRFEPGKKCALHYHGVKDETFYIGSGIVVVHYCENVSDYIEQARGKIPMRYRILTEGESFHVPPGMVHMIEARTYTKIFEFSTRHDDLDSYYLKRGDEVDWGFGSVPQWVRDLEPIFDKGLES